MTVAELRERLAEVPDDAVVLVENDWDEFFELRHARIKRAQRLDDGTWEIGGVEGARTVVIL